MKKARTAFNAKKHGFRFVNRFDTSLDFNLPLVGDIDVGELTVGLAGGMCFAALDFFHAGKPVPSLAKGPASGTLLYQYLSKRQIDSLSPPSGVLKVLDWVVRSDSDLSRLTAGREFKKLSSRLDMGQPAVLALIRDSGIEGASRNHQVVASNYEFDESAKQLTVEIYDPNHPGSDVQLTMAFVNQAESLGARQSTGEPLRGIFVIDYTPEPPPEADEAKFETKAPPLEEESLISEEIYIASRALADNPSEVDLLGFEDYAEALVDFIRNENTKEQLSSGPLTIGIDAPWGMGKTTLMKMIKRSLSPEDEATTQSSSYPVVWFNAWQFDQEESLWAAFALEILSQVRARLTVPQRAFFWLKLNWKRFDWGRLLRSTFRALAYVVGISALGAVVFTLAAFGLGTTVGEIAEGIATYIKVVGGVGALAALYAAGKEVRERIAGPFELNIAQYVREPDYQERIGFFAQFKEDFKRVIEVVTSKGETPLVVFVDDLDRCSPPKPAEVIEAINLLLDARHCVFVLGMDARAVAASIEAKYRDLLPHLKDAGGRDRGGLTLGQRFLEKIVQINFRIPIADPSAVQSFLDANLSALAKQRPERRASVADIEELIKAEQGKGTSLDAAVEAVRAARSEISKEDIDKAKQAIFAESFDESEDVRRAIVRAALFLAFNPRKMKRFINHFRLRALVANRRGLLNEGVIRLDLLAEWVIIETRWPDVIFALSTDRDLLRRLREAHQIQEKLARSEYAPDEGKEASDRAQAPVDCCGCQSSILLLFDKCFDVTMRDLAEIHLALCGERQQEQLQLTPLLSATVRWLASPFSLV